VKVRRMRSVARRLLSAEDCPDDTEVSVLLVSDEEIKALNRDYRGVGVVTDVLAFSQLEGEEFGADGGNVLGDVVISVETATRQAQEHAHSVEDEMDLLLVHGLLHLLGYDHKVPEDEKRMFARQQQLLESA